MYLYVLYMYFYILKIKEIKIKIKNKIIKNHSINIVVNIKIYHNKTRTIKQ